MLNKRFGLWLSFIRWNCWYFLNICLIRMGLWPLLSFFGGFKITIISGRYAPFILTPAEVFFGGPSNHHLGLWPNDLIVFDHMCLQTCMPNFKSLAWLEVCQEPLIIISDLKDFEGSWLETWRTWVIFDILNNLHIWFSTWVPNFCFLAWL